MSSAVQLVIQVIEIYIIILFIRLVFDYVQMFARSWTPRGVVLVFAEVIYTLTDPPLRVGSVSLDLSFIVVVVALWVLVNVLTSLG